jgi:hypothetical protein
VPARTATIPVRVYDPAQPQPVLQTTVPVQSTTATTTAITHAPADCTMPPVASPGGVEVIHVANGGSSGDVSQISVTVDDTPATIVAAKPGTVFWNVPDTMAAGLHHVRFVPGRDAPAVMLPVYVMTLQMSAERTSLIRGQSTTMHVTVAGLDKMPASLWKAATPPADLVDVPSLEQRAKGFRPPKQAGPGVVLLVIENHSIAQIHMGKAGDRIVLELGQKDFASGPYSYADKLQSLNSGSFDIGSIATAFLADAEGN